jgi:hypothetical protein
MARTLFRRTRHEPAQNPEVSPPSALTPGVSNGSPSFTVEAKPAERTSTRRMSLAPVAVATVLIGAWGGIVAYVGPTFGYQADGSPSWYWDFQHALLHLIPGAVAVAAGLLILAVAVRPALTARRPAGALLTIVVAACGAWFVLGPVVWPIFYSGPVFLTSGAQTNMVNQLGYNLGPGLVLTLLSGMGLALAVGRDRPADGSLPAQHRRGV